MSEFVQEHTVPFPVERVFGWHMRPGALERLLPPWEDVRVVGRQGGIDDGGTVHLQIRRGPLRVDFRVRHTAFEANRVFCDEQVSGPMGSWRHRHEFDPKGEDACVIRDRISYEPPLGAAAKALAGSTIENEMRRLFRFRNRRIVSDLRRHSAYSGPPLKVAITGASGFIGRALTHFLTTGGHDVVPIVRRRPRRDRGEVFWDPVERKIEGQRLEGLDAVVHLAGESLSRGRWNAAKKKAIWQSRVVGTRLLAGALARLRRPPKVLVSSSAIGFYGNRGSEVLAEDSRPGHGFLADLCRAWEKEALAVRSSDLRVVLLRTGLVLSPAGGALGTMLLPFKMGVGGRLGGGRQYVSWIDHDDLVGLVFHSITTPTISGPVNATSPHPVPNATFTTVLGRVLRRPTVVPVPSMAVKGIFGEMGQALLLDGARVIPRAALTAGFRFEFDGLAESLAFQLGRPVPAS